MKGTLLTICALVAVVYCQPPFRDDRRGERPTVLPPRPPQGPEQTAGVPPASQPGEPGRPRGPPAETDGIRRPCRIVDLTTNDTNEIYTCPGETNCTFQPFSINPSIQVYHCSPPFFHPLSQPCKMIDVSKNTSTEGLTCPPNSTCSVVEHYRSNPNIQNVYCTHPMIFRPPPPCRVVDVAKNETVSSFPCPPGSSCEVLDTANTDRTVEKYFCTRPPRSGRPEE